MSMGGYDVCRLKVFFYDGSQYKVMFLYSWCRKGREHPQIMEDDNFTVLNFLICSLSLPTKKESNLLPLVKGLGRDDS